jgi:phage tail-like protein
VRGAVDGLPTAVPVAQQLPAVMQEDDFLTRFVQAFDDGLAPVLATLDNLQVYVQPDVAPVDFLQMLADWLGLDSDGRWTIEQRRSLVAQAIDLHRRRGTASGLRDLLKLLYPGDVEILDSGGTSWSPVANGQFPGDNSQAVRVTVRAAKGADVDHARLSALVASLKPAHIHHAVKVETT